MSISELLIGNCPYPFWDQISWVCFAENFVRSILGENDNTDDAYFINIGYDKQIVDVQVTSTDTGRSVITDRKVLLDFLTIAERADYKYIFLDIRFEKGYNTEWDKALFSKIAGMRNIVVAHHYEETDNNGKITNGFELADTILLPKIAYNDYYTTIFSASFTRYQYLQDGRPSVALRMYQDIDRKKMEHKGILYFNDGTLCENCPYIPIKGSISPLKEDGSKADYFNLGPFLLTMPEDMLIEDMKGKIIVVGDFINDIHDTYMGMQSGSYLTYAAYKYLAKGGNKVSIVKLIIITILFYFIIRTQLLEKQGPPFLDRISGRPYLRWVSRVKKWRIVMLFTSFVSYTLLLSIVCSIIYMTSGYTFNIGLPALLISILSTIKNTNNTE